jgi:hypothetical protein
MRGHSNNVAVSLLKIFLTPILHFEVGKVSYLIPLAVRELRSHLAMAANSMTVRMAFSFVSEQPRSPKIAVASQQDLVFRTNRHDHSVAFRLSLDLPSTTYE